MTRPGQRLERVLHARRARRDASRAALATASTRVVASTSQLRARRRRLGEVGGVEGLLSAGEVERRHRSRTLWSRGVGDAATALEAAEQELAACDAHHRELSVAVAGLERLLERHRRRAEAAAAAQERRGIEDAVASRARRKAT